MELGSQEGGEAYPREEHTLYRPLKEKEFRILEILPGADEHDIHCRLQYTNLDDPVEYNALSYTWGDPTKPKAPIIVDGHVLEVTENCGLALQELRREATTASRIQTIWIDAICINQTDIPERNQQVRCMRSIYRNSKKLIIWLGPEADGSTEIVELWKQIPDWHDQEAFDQFHRRFEPDSDEPNLWLALAAFFSRSWFTRIWVIQEYVVCAEGGADQSSTDLTQFYCGGSRLPSKELRKFIQSGRSIIDSSYSDTELKMRNEQIYFGMSRGVTCLLHILNRTTTEYRRENQQHAANQFLSDVLSGLSFESTEPRDRIYANLGSMIEFQSDIPDDPSRFSLAGERTVDDASNLIIDYNSSIEDVYSSFVRYTVLATKSLNILSLCRQGSRNRTKTWSIDLQAITDNKRGRPLGEKRFLLHDSCLFNLRHTSFRASNDALALAKFNNLAILSVEGFKLSTIQRCFEVRIVETNVRISFLMLKHMTGILSESLLDHRVYNTRVRRYKALWNTWLGGDDVADVYALFEKWLTWLDSDVQTLEELNTQELYRKWKSQAPHDEILGTWMGIAIPQIPRDLFQMSDGRIVKAWDSAKPGDIVCIILGCDVPLVLRRVDNYYELVGDCYVEGIMEGQAMKDLEEGKVKLETFDLH